jgi:hypothetical protein
MPTKDEVDQEASERRRWRRYHLTVPVRVTIEKHLQVSVIKSRSSQMNDGGLAVYADTELTIGDEADLEFTPPHFDRALTLRGVVRNHKGDLYGVEFLATGPELALYVRFTSAFQRSLGLDASHFGPQDLSEASQLFPFRSAGSAPNDQCERNSDQPG